MAQKRIDICMLAYNNAGFIGEILENLQRNVVSRLDCRVLALDNGSTDGTFKVLERFPFVTPFRVEQNRFFTGGANFLFEKCDADHVFFMSSDISPREGTIENIVEYAERNPKAGLIGCKSVLRTGTVEFSAKRQPTPGLLHHMHGLPGSIKPWYRKVMDAYLYKDEGFPFSEPTPVDVVQDSFIYLRGGLIRSGLRYDTRYKLYYTEDDICMTVRKLGMEVVYFPGAEVGHISQATANQKKKDISDIYRADSKVYCLKYFGPLQFTLVAADLKLKTMIKSLVPG